MGDRTGIEWADSTWNPVAGCTKVSSGCDHCYAEGIAQRFSGTPAYPRGFTVTLHPDRLHQPLRWRRPRRVFVNSMSDLFHDDIPDDYIAEVWAVMALASTHTFQILTKRPGRMHSLLSSAAFRTACEDAEALIVNDPDAPLPTWRRHDEQRKWWSRFAHPLPNVWLGVSVENQRWADIRIPALLQTPAAVRFISAEPLLGAVSLSGYLDLYECPNCSVTARWTDGQCQRLGDERDEYWCQHCRAESPLTACARRGLDWVIVGGESGPGARPMHPAWARQLRDQVAVAEVPFLFKQWGEWIGYAAGGDASGRGRGPWAHREPDVFVRDDGADMDEAAALADGGTFHGMWRVGKHAAGRQLDGRTYDQFPTAASR